jgi:predicted enzyme related to lactoylglutathione lyase
MRITAIWFPVTDWETAKDFYGRVLALPATHINDTDGWAAYATGGVPLFIVRRPPRARGDDTHSLGGAIVTFASDDLEALRDRIEAAGARVENRLENSGDLLIMTFYDPDGHRLEASQVVEREQS